MKTQYRILGTGSYLPPLRVSNDDFAAKMDTSDEWIRTRTGICYRHLSDGEETWEMASKAARQAIRAADISPLDINVIIVTTLTPDYATPSTACLVQGEIGADRAFCMDVNAACTGFIQGFDIAMRYIRTMENCHVLLISAESLSKIVDFEDRSTCVLFGDGAGALVISNANEKERLFASCLYADGKNGASMIAAAFPIANHPFRNPNQPSHLRYGEMKKPFLEMQGQEVYRFATTAMPKAVEDVVAEAKLTMDDVQYLIPHQANIRILVSASKHLHIPEDRVLSTIDETGNTSSASIPICLDTYIKNGKIKRGDILVLTGFGGGLTYGAVCVEY